MTDRTSVDGRKVRRCRGDEGVSLVEFAFVLPILAMLIFGIIDFGIAYNDYQSLRSGVRDAARQAAVYNLDSDTSCPDNAGDAAASAPMQNVRCMVKNKAGLGDNVRVKLYASPSWDVGNTLKVCAQAAASSTTGITGVFLNGKVMNAKVEMRIEQALPTGTTWANGQESPLDSNGWPSGCSS